MEIAGITLTHPERVLWRTQGITKGDLAAYYAGIAGRILPHVANRPLTLVRCPSGNEKACFVQKHPWAGLPKAVRRVRDGDDEWLAVDDASGLVALVQMGVLELHPWGATVDDLERPDRIVFDFDPDDGVPWAHVVEGARAIRAALDGLGLQSFVKTTGGKGLHVVVPVEPRAGWDAVKEFAHDVAARLADEQPERYTTNPLKEAREGRIFLDHLRNSRGATAVAPYSTRARPGAPVALPLAWEALGDDPAALRHGIGDMPKGDPWEEFFEVRQRLPG
ncbi:non-homologous end-joining DNA ligase [Azospirillum soli]|uniref:non-homologous end-joining DNA ligase n=1 Tax=Azospirillum soli TaxID=1304799 RepID=UPI001AEB9BED|nr:non-homologous end-joining DNA ligase [Azospirillum soli]MBP2313013.1 DNA ligase D [Azospirillum soli]